MKKFNTFCYIRILITVICLLIENKFLNLKLKMRMLTFQVNFVWEVFIMALVLVNLDR